jgi:hypothetical protein
MSDEDYIVVDLGGRHIWLNKAKVPHRKIDPDGPMPNGKVLHATGKFVIRDDGEVAEIYEPL